jgi:CheY-like chemotaxis protein
LAICRRLAILMGGQIEITSEPGKGSNFTFWLPLEIAADPPAGSPQDSDFGEDGDIPPGSADSPSQADPTLRARILLVEDGPDIQLLVEHVLSRAGAEVVIAEDGADGVARAREAVARGVPFDLIFMDLQMPGLDGYAATRLLREYGIQTPIIALTADDLEVNRLASRAAGCTGFVAKPIDTRRLMEVIRQLLAEREDA